MATTPTPLAAFAPTISTTERAVLPSALRPRARRCSALLPATTGLAASSTMCSLRRAKYLSRLRLTSFWRLAGLHSDGSARAPNGSAAAAALAALYRPLSLRSRARRALPLYRALAHVGERSARSQSVPRGRREAAEPSLSVSSPVASSTPAAAAVVAAALAAAASAASPAAPAPAPRPGPPFPPTFPPTFRLASFALARRLRLPFGAFFRRFWSRSLRLSHSLFFTSRSLTRRRLSK